MYFLTLHNTQNLYQKEVLSRAKKYVNTINGDNVSLV
jgi:hypothetical protein